MVLPWKHDVFQAVIAHMPVVWGELYGGNSALIGQYGHPGAQLSECLYNYRYHESILAEIVTYGLWTKWITNMLKIYFKMNFLQWVLSYCDLDFTHSCGGLNGNKVALVHVTFFMSNDQQIIIWIHNDPVYWVTCTLSQYRRICAPQLSSLA